MPPSSPVSSRPCSSRAPGPKQNTGTYMETLYLAKYLRWYTKVLQVLRYLHAIQTTASQTVRIPPTTSYPGMTMEFNFYGLHRETPFLLWFWHHPSYSGSSVETGHIHPHSRHYHFNRTSMPFCDSCLFKARGSVSCYIRLRLRICLSFLLLSRYCLRHETSLHQQIPSGGKQSSRTNQSDIRIVSPHILQLPTGQLVWTVTSGGICLQQCPQRYHWCLPFFHQQRILS